MLVLDLTLGSIVRKKMLLEVVLIRYSQTGKGNTKKKKRLEKTVTIKSSSSSIFQLSQSFFLFLFLAGYNTSSTRYISQAVNAPSLSLHCSLLPLKQSKKSIFQFISLNRQKDNHHHHLVHQQVSCQTPVLYFFVFVCLTVL